jgi:alpha-beta hydrolase superfamily lysophospholipase
MKKIVGSIVFLIGIMVIIVLIARNYNLKNIERNVIVVYPEKVMPSDKLPADRMQIQLKDRILYANWVSAGKAAPSFFMLHGNGETLSDWRPLQAYLLQKGYSSYIFDYTGFGSSSGKPTVDKLDEDASAAYKKFAALTTESAQRIAFAHSLGCGILLNVANELQPLPDKIVIHGAFSTGRDILVEKGMFTEYTKWLVPDIWNGLKQVGELKMPVYVLHSPNDKTIPIAMSEELAKVAGSNGRFLRMVSPGHNSVYESPNESTWEQIFNLIK